MHTKPEWPYAADEWVVIAARNPRVVHRLRSWANGLIGVACGVFPLLGQRTGMPRAFVVRKSDHDLGNWEGIFELPRCRKCWDLP